MPKFVVKVSKMVEREFTFEAKDGNDAWSTAAALINPDWEAFDVSAMEDGVAQSTGDPVFDEWEKQEILLQREQTLKDATTYEGTGLVDVVGSEG